MLLIRHTCAIWLKHLQSALQPSKNCVSSCANLKNMDIAQNSISNTEASLRLEGFGENNEEVGNRNFNEVFLHPDLLTLICLNS